MRNKWLVYLLYGSIFFVLLGLVGFEKEVGGWSVLIGIGAFVYYYAGTYFLLKNGSFYHSIEFRRLRLGFAILLVGIMFKILHYQGASIILSLGVFSLPLTYLLFMIHQKRYAIQNWGRALFLLLTAFEVVTNLFHLPNSDFLLFANFSLLTVLLVEVRLSKKFFQLMEN